MPTLEMTSSEGEERRGWGEGTYKEVGGAREDAAHPYCQQQKGVQRCLSLVV